MSTQPTHDSKFKWWICVLLLLASTLNYMDRQALSQTSARISDYFQISNTQLGQLESAFNIAFAVGVFSIGMIVDKANIRVIYPVIVVLWSLAGFASGYASSFTYLLICRLALGLFEAGNIPCGILTVKRVLKPEERALGNGMFQSGTALGAIITPLVVLLCLMVVERTTTDNPAFAWQLPFRVVGAIGLLWAAAWLLTVRTHHVQAPPSTTPVEASDTYWAIFQNRRFWVALLVVMSINAPWRSFGFWLPKMLQKEKEYSEISTLWITPGFFFAADLGSLTVGFVTLWLARRGFTLHRARLLCFLGCTLLTTLSVLSALAPKGPLLIAVLYLMGFGALGLFPIYYALSQDISSKHQGKVTGTLSCLNAGYLAVLFPLQGLLIDNLQSFSLALGVVGVFPIVGLLALAFFWKKPS
ncbi:MAG: MFS transporter [Gemmataceae bacterium]|nr:MFS transporter [Gemmataceae bacterium]